MMEDPIKIVLVDDHRLFRSGIASLINNLTGYKIIFEADNGEELIRRISPKFKPDIILLDMNMPVMNGESTAQWLVKNYLEIRIIAVDRVTKDVFNPSGIQVVQSVTSMDRPEESPRVTTDRSKPPQIIKSPFGSPVETSARAQ